MVDQFPDEYGLWRAKLDSEPPKTEPGKIIGQSVVGDLIRLKVKKPDGTRIVGDVLHTPSNVAQILTGTIDLPVDDENH